MFLLTTPMWLIYLLFAGMAIALIFAVLALFPRFFGRFLNTKLRVGIKNPRKLSNIWATRKKVSDFPKKFINEHFKFKKRNKLVSLGPKHSETVKSLSEFLNFKKVQKPQEAKVAISEYFEGAKTPRWQNIETSIPEEHLPAVRGYTPGSKPELFIIVKEDLWTVKKNVN